MHQCTSLILAAVAALMLANCSTPALPPVDPKPVSKAVFRDAARRLTAIVVSERDDIDSWVGSRFTAGRGPDDADGGSAIPITPDGYFLTADHVLASSQGRNVFVIYGHAGTLSATPSRIVWRSPSSDLALIHAPIDTPYYYEWSEPSRWAPSGTPIMHAGIATGFKSPAGRLITSIPPETTFSNNRRFKHDIPLEPGDSGGPVVNAYGRLIGVNSAVEFLVPLETAFFIESEANRPNTRRLRAIIAKDRKKLPAPPVSSAT